MQCGSCSLDYNNKENLPYLIKCGHSLCKTCLELFEDMLERRCPSCDFIFSKEHYNDFIENVDLIELLQNVNDKRMFPPLLSILDTIERLIIFRKPKLTQKKSILESKISYLKMRIVDSNEWLTHKDAIKTQIRRIGSTNEFYNVLEDVRKRLSIMEELIPNVQHVEQTLDAPFRAENTRILDKFTLKDFKDDIQREKQFYVWYGNGFDHKYGKITVDRSKVFVHCLEKEMAPLGTKLYKFCHLYDLIDVSHPLIFFDIEQISKNVYVQSVSEKAEDSTKSNGTKEISTWDRIIVRITHLSNLSTKLLNMCMGVRSTNFKGQHVNVSEGNVVMGKDVGDLGAVGDVNMHIINQGLEVTAIVDGLVVGRRSPEDGLCLEFYKSSFNLGKATHYMIGRVEKGLSLIDEMEEPHYVKDCGFVIDLDVK